MNFVTKGKYFKMNMLINFEPVRGFENRRNVRNVEVLATLIRIRLSRIATRMFANNT